MRGAGQGRRVRTLTSAACLLLATGLLLFAGCATADKVGMEADQPAPATSKSSSAVPTGPSVVHFTDGREGFLITEPSGLDVQARADFDQASAMIKAEQYDKAIELLEKIVAKSPETSAPHINLAIAYRRVDKPEQAEQQLKKALELIPGHPVASNEYGLLLRKAGRFAESRQVYEKSLALFPEYYPIHRNLGILCDLYLNDPVCAVTQYEIYEKALPKDTQVKIWLADLHARSGQ